MQCTKHQIKRKWRNIYQCLTKDCFLLKAMRDQRMIITNWTKTFRKETSNHDLTASSDCRVYCWRLSVVCLSPPSAPRPRPRMLRLTPWQGWRSTWWVSSSCHCSCHVMWHVRELWWPPRSWPRDTCLGPSFMAASWGRVTMAGTEVTEDTDTGDMGRTVTQP